MILQFLKSKVAVFHLIVSFKANRVLHNLVWVWSLLVTMYSLRFFHFVETICASAFVRAMLGGAGSSMLRMASPTCASSELCFPFLGFNKIAFVIRQEEAHMQQGARCTEKNWNQDTHLEFSVLLHQHNNSLSYCRDTGYFPFLPLPSSQQPWFPYHCSLRGSHTLTGTLTGSTQAFPDSAMAPLCRLV
ncbi:uncharacterized protein [Triticum aestivum]|nr:uncharacterized protein LOC109778279 isoform X3 [Aegilops tauschii subsp. strangulata]XP_044374605.1 uncharacterized protein LOC123096884 isoform X3 [Triticum aestivum]